MSQQQATKTVTLTPDKLKAGDVYNNRQGKTLIIERVEEAYKGGDKHPLVLVGFRIEATNLGQPYLDFIYADTTILVERQKAARGKKKQG